MASLYLHIPFCEHKCVYCDFYSIESRDPVPAFLEALNREIGLSKAVVTNEKFETIFFGGGTPSLLDPETIGGIVARLRDTFDVDPRAEVTLESNPGTISRSRLDGYRAAGVNRISYGVQSFSDDDLAFLTRIHSSAQAVDAVSEAREAGFGNVSVDLIFALPGQSLSRWTDHLGRAISLGVDHISAYSLIVERNTPLARMVDAGTVRTLPAELEAGMYLATMDIMRKAGFEHYEISNYAKPGFHSRHNMNYWNHSNYLGLGPSAHSYWNGRRWWNVSNVQGYVDRIAARQLPLIGDELLTEEQLRDEAVMLGLRTGALDLDAFAVRFGHGLNGGVVDEFCGEGFAVLDGRVLRLTDRGYLFCDEMTRRLTAVFA